jgi:hypothetical protein
VLTAFVAHYNHARPHRGLKVARPSTIDTTRLSGPQGPLPEELRRSRRSPLLTVSIMTRIAFTVGIST